MVLDVTVIFIEAPAAEKLSEAGVAVRNGADAEAAACVTATVRVMPPPVTVTLAVRSPPTFAGAVTLTVPPFAPDAGEILSHEAELTDVQAVLAVTVIFIEAPGAPKLSEAGATVRDGAGAEAAACVTPTVCVMPPPAMVIVAVRAAPAFAAAVTETVLLLLPEDGLTVAHASELTTVQLTPDVTVTLAEPPEAGKSSVAGETVRPGVDTAAACVTPTVCVMPPPAMVIVAVRAAPAFAAAVTETVPSLLPEDGVTVAHASELLAVQPTSDVTVMLSEPPEAVKSNVAGETVREAGSEPVIWKSFHTSAAPYSVSVPAGTCRVQDATSTSWKKPCNMFKGVDMSKGVAHST
jgi:hypothetical protein